MHSYRAFNGSRQASSTSSQYSIPMEGGVGYKSGTTKSSLIPKLKVGLNTEYAGRLASSTCTTAPYNFNVALFMPSWLECWCWGYGYHKDRWPPSCCSNVHLVLWICWAHHAKILHVRGWMCHGFCCAKPKYKFPSYWNLTL